MSDPDTWTMLLDALSFAFLLASASLMHRRLRSRASRRFLWSTLAILLWVPCAAAVMSFSSRYDAAQDPHHLFGYAAYFIMEISPSLIGLACMVNLWLAVRSLAPRREDGDASENRPTRARTDAEASA